MAFRYSIGTLEKDASVVSWRLFDWQTTPLEAVCEYFERDFEGVFELEDLEPTEFGIRNVRFKTFHLHEFAASPGETILTQDQLTQQYPLARKNFDLLVDDFRALLHRPGPYLYVLATPGYPDLAAIQRLIGLLGRDPSHRFHLLIVGIEGADSDLSAAGDIITKAWRILDTIKPLKWRWEGHDASWDKALAPFSLGVHKIGFHDPTAARRRNAAPPGSQPSDDARLIWRGGPEAIFSYDVWRDHGAVLEHGEGGARIETVPVAWSYSHAAKLDLSHIDLDRQDGWIRLTVADVSGRLMAALFDIDNNVMGEEVRVDEGGGPSLVHLRIWDKSKSMLIMRTGQFDEAARARILDVDIVAADKR